MRADKSLSPFEIRVYRHYRIVHGTRVALAFLLTFLIIRLFTIIPFILAESKQQQDDSEVQELFAQGPANQIR